MVNCAKVFAAAILMLLCGTIDDQIRSLLDDWRSEDHVSAEKAEMLFTLMPDAEEAEIESVFLIETEAGSFVDGTLLRSALADGVPIVSRLFLGMDEEQKEQFLTQYFQPLGRMARPAADMLKQFATDDSTALRLAAFDALVLSTGHDVFVESQLRDAFSGAWTGGEAAENRAAHLLRLLQKRPMKKLEDDLIKIADSHTSANLRYAALEALICSDGQQSDRITAILVSKLQDAFVVTLQNGERVGCYQLAESELSKRVSLPNVHSADLVSILYKSTYEPANVSPVRLAEFICRYDDLDPRSLSMIEHRFPAILDSTTWMPGTAADALFVRVSIARVLLKFIPGDTSASQFLRRVITGEVTAVSPPKSQTDFRELAITAYHGVRTCGRDDAELLRDLLSSANEESPGSRFETTVALAVASFDPQNRIALEVLQRLCTIRNDGSLPLNHELWVELRLCLGDKVDQLVSEQQVINETRSAEQFLRYIDDPLYWKLRRRHLPLLLPSLRLHFQSGNPAIRKHVMCSARYIDESNTDLLSLLLAGTLDRCAAVRAEAADSLGQHSWNDTSAATRLREMKMDPKLTVQIAAFDALERLDRQFDRREHQGRKDPAE
ncbi:MAG: hypothetical protein WCK86_21370 [Planctomycetia bacterium]